MVEVRTPSNSCYLEVSRLEFILTRKPCVTATTSCWMSQSSEDFQWWKFVLQVTSCYLEVSRLEFILTSCRCCRNRTHKKQVSIQRGLPMVEVRTPSNKLLLGSISPGVYFDPQPRVLSADARSAIRSQSSISPGVYFDYARQQHLQEVHQACLNPVSRLEFILTTLVDETATTCLESLNPVSRLEFILTIKSASCCVQEHQR